VRRIVAADGGAIFLIYKNYAGFKPERNIFAQHGRPDIN
jgi:hypothetical protein